MTTSRRGFNSNLALEMRSTLSMLALLAVGTSAMAQSVVEHLVDTPDSTGGGGLAEIVVTAEKRSESLQRVPLSVTAFTAEALEARGITGMASLMGGDLPSLKVEPFAGNPSIFTIGIRGFINTQGQDVTNENPVPIYIDDVYYGRQIATALELNDLERIEVLRGPQGTLFGKNAEGGAVRFISKEPTGVFDVNATFEGGNLGYKKGIAHIDLPAVAGVSAKLDLLGTDNNGFTNNAAPSEQNFGVTQSVGGKLTLLYKTDTLRLEYAGDYTRLRSTEMWNAKINSTDPYNSPWPVEPRFPTSEPYAVYRPLDDQAYWGHRLTGALDLSNSVTLKSITAFRSDQATIYNTASPVSVVPGPFFSPGYFTTGVCVLGPTICGGVLTGVIPEYIVTHKQYSEELQLTGKQAQLDWVAGLFFIHEQARQDQITTYNTVLPNSLGSPATGFLPLTSSTSAILFPAFGPVGDAGASVIEKSYAAFGQATWRPPGFDDKLGFTVGVRIGRDEKSATRPAPGVVFTTVTPANPDGTFSGGFLCPQSPQCTHNIKQTKTNPLATVSYNWTPDISTYFRYSTGYQAPGLSVGSQTFQFVNSSSVNSYEVGFKSEVLEHTLRVNLAAFYTIWHDPQENIQTVSTSTGEFFSGPDIKISGLDVDVAYEPTAALHFDGSLSYLHGKQAHIADPFAALLGTVGRVQAALALVALPDWAASVGATYDIARTSHGLWRFSVQENGTASYNSVPNAPPINTYWLTNARLSLTDVPMGLSGGRLEVSAWAKNLTDRSYRTYLYEAPGTAPGTFSTDASYGFPRTYGLALNFRFN